MAFSSADDSFQPAASKGETRPLRIVIPGGSGQIGRVLADYLQQQGHHVAVLTRGPYAANWQTVHWDGETEGPWVESLEGIDVLINLSGYTINCRPSLDNRRKLWESRIHSTRLLHSVVKQLKTPPKLWMNASAATIYDRFIDEKGVDLPLYEEDYCTQPAFSDSEGWRNGKNFLPRLVRAWEEAFFAYQVPGMRQIALRSGVTFSPARGNVFEVISRITRLSLGGQAGNGRQYMPWIHELDYARAVDFLIQQRELQGAFNLTAPNPVANRDFMAVLRYAWGVPNGIPAPGFGIRLGAFLMNSNAELVLGSCRAVPHRLQKAGFHFAFTNWAEAAHDLVRRYKQRG